MRDYLRQKIEKWQDGVPYDEYGHALNSTELYDANGRTKDRQAATEAREITNPYGSLHFCVGSGDDFWCFDFAELADGRIAVHVAMNGSGSLEQLHYGIHDKEEGFRQLRHYVDEAVSWVVDCHMRHDRKGWNQDPFYVVREYLRSVLRVLPFANYADKQLRFGTGPSDRGWILLASEQT